MLICKKFSKNQCSQSLTNFRSQRKILRFMEALTLDMEDLSKFSRSPKVQITIKVSTTSENLLNTAGQS